MFGNGLWCGNAVTSNMLLRAAPAPLPALTDASGDVVWEGQWDTQWPAIDDARLESLLPRIVDNAVVDGTDRYCSAIGCP